MKYRFPGYRRGILSNVTRFGLSMPFLVFGMLLILGAGLPLAFASGSVDPGSVLIPLTAGLVLASAGVWIERATRRRKMRSETALKRRWGTKPQMVFLRPFGVEELRVPANPGPRRDGFELLIPRRSEFLEDVLTWLLWSRGEVLAIAKPDKRRMKAVGAAHHAIAEGATWTDAVSHLLEKAKGIVLVPGATPGVAWEYEKVSQNPDFARKALLVNPEPLSDASAFAGLVGISDQQEEELRRRRLLPLAAIPRPTGPPKLLCGGLAEDLDYEVAVEWFLRKELPPPGGSENLVAIAKGVLGALTRANRR